MTKAKGKPRRSLVRYIWCTLMADSIWDGAAVLSFYFLLSSVPALLILMATATLFPIENFSRDFAQWSVSHIPFGIREIFLQITEGFQGQRLTQLISLGFFVALWTGISGVSAVIRQLNIVYGVKETRSYFKVKWVSLMIALALGVVLFAGFALLLIGNFLSALVFEVFDIPQVLSSTFPIFRYFVLEGLVLVLFAVIYSMGPSREKKLTLFSRGSVFGSITFLLSTHCFAHYLNTYADYGAIYGKLGASIGLMMWLYILGFLLLLGAELNYASQVRRPKLSGQ